MIRRLNVERSEMVWLLEIQDGDKDGSWWTDRIGGIFDWKAVDVLAVESKNRVRVSGTSVFNSKSVHMSNYFFSHWYLCDVICGNKLASVEVVWPARASTVRNLANSDAAVCAGSHAVVGIASGILVATSKFELDVNSSVRRTIVQELEKGEAVSASGLWEKVGSCSHEDD